MADNMDKKEKKEPLPKSNKSFCSCTCLLYTLALIGVVIAGGYYYINHGCNLSNEHEEMNCPIIFFLRTMPIIMNWRIKVIGLANWGVVDFKQSMQSYVNTWNMNRTLSYTHNITQDDELDLVLINHMSD